MAFRKEGEGLIPANTAELVLSQVDRDIADGQIRVVEMDAPTEVEFNALLARCYRHAPPIPLRTFDAIHLATARVAGQTEIVATDKRMRDAAKLLGFSVFLCESLAGNSQSTQSAISPLRRLCQVTASSGGAFAPAVEIRIPQWLLTTSRHSRPRHPPPARVLSRGSLLADSALPGFRPEVATIPRLNDGERPLPHRRLPAPLRLVRPGA